MPVLTKRSDRVVTLSSITKAYDNFHDATTPSGQLWDNGSAILDGVGMYNIQGSQNYAWAQENDPADPVVLATLGYSQAEIDVIMTSSSFYNYYHGRFNDTNFGTLSSYGNSDDVFDIGAGFFDVGIADVGGYVYIFDFGFDGSVLPAILTFNAGWHSFAVDGTNQSGILADISFSAGLYSWSAGLGDAFVLSFERYQVEWPTAKVMVLGSGSNTLGTYSRIYGMILDGTDVMVPINVANLDGMGLDPRMIGNNQDALGNNDTALFMHDGTDCHLYRMNWTAQTWDSGDGTFDNTQQEYTFDDAALNTYVRENTFNSMSFSLLERIAQPNGCNFMVCNRSGRNSGVAEAPFLIVISKDWDWYDMVTFAAGDAGAAAIIANYSGLDYDGNISYNADEGVLYFVSGPGDPFTYATGPFDPCEAPPYKRRKMTKIYCA